MQKIGRRDYHLFGAMHIRGLKFVDVGIIYPILDKVLFKISYTNYENILAHNTALAEIVGHTSPNPVTNMAKSHGAHHTKFRQEMLQRDNPGWQLAN